MMMRDIVNGVARVSGVSPKEIMGVDRKRLVAHPRQLAMYLIRKYIQVFDGVRDYPVTPSLPRIGRFFNRDHTTVIYACEQILGRIERTDPARWRILELSILALAYGSELESKIMAYAVEFEMKNCPTAQPTVVTNVDNAGAVAI